MKGQVSVIQFDLDLNLLMKDIKIGLIFGFYCFPGLFRSIQPKEVVITLIKIKSTAY